MNKENSFCTSEPTTEVLCKTLKSAAIVLALTIGSSAWSADSKPDSAPASTKSPLETPSGSTPASAKPVLETPSGSTPASTKPVLETPSDSTPASTKPGGVLPEPHPGTLEGQASVLQEEAKKLDQSMQAFNLHAETYNRSKIHQVVLQHQNSTKTKPKREASASATASASHPLNAKIEENSQVTLTPEIPQLSSTDLQSRIETVHKLHKEFESHVTQLRALVDQYHSFYNLYSRHYNQFKGQLQDYKLQAEKAKLDLSTPKFNLGATKQATNLASSEKQLAIVLKKMIALEEESPHLSENYLCPAFEDLQKEFVVALAGLTTAIQALPPEQVKVVAQKEVAQLQVIKSEMDDAQRLHEEQLSLKDEYMRMQKNYAEINAKHAELAKEATSESEHVDRTKKTLEKQKQP